MPEQPAPDPSTTPTRLARDKPPRPYQASFEGYAAGESWPNTLTVTAVSVPNPQPGHTTTEDGDERDAADAAADERQLVCIDTNYKPTRPGQHPVHLTRSDGARFVAAVLEALEDTFHYARVGGLRAVEAAELLRAIEEVDVVLFQLREHALGDLLRHAGIEPPAPDGRGGGS
ncbi:MAG: hypothetical protein GEV09_01320 [Pseudonocardiaceae bacterium]|nr:hypothetical protein [Pseudonocardiaceae bacterium]